VPSPDLSGVEPNGELCPAVGDAIALVRPRLRVGRRESCDICLRHPNVSGIHCELSFRGGYWVVRDLHSTNGVKVNGRRVEATLLHPGDTISIGKGEYTISYTPPSAADLLAPRPW
jgi:adenylate cyclase